MTGQLPQEPTSWANFLSACVAVLTPGALFGLFLLRKVRAALLAYQVGDAKLRQDFADADALLAARLSDLAGNTLHDIEAHAQQSKTDHKALEADVDRRFDKVNDRIDAVVVGMARRDDLSRVEDKIDQLLRAMAVAVK